MHNIMLLRVYPLLGLLISTIGAQNSKVIAVNSGDSTVSIYSAINVTSGPALRLAKVLPVGKTPSEVCLSPDKKRAYVPNGGEASISVIDLDGNTVLSTISDPSLKRPDGCVVNPSGSKLYVAAAGGDSVFVFSTADGRKVNEFKTGSEPRRIIFSPAGERLYVSNGGERYISVFDAKTETAIGKIKAGRDPRAMVFMPGGQYLAISNVSEDTVEFVDAKTNEPDFFAGVPKSPQRLVPLAAKELLLSLGRFDNVVSMMDVRPTKEYGRFITNIPVGRAPWDMALSADGNCLYVTNTGDNTITIIELRLMRPTALPVATGKAPMGLAVR